MRNRFLLTSRVKKGGTNKKKKKLLDKKTDERPRIGGATVRTKCNEMSCEKEGQSSQRFCVSGLSMLRFCCGLWDGISRSAEFCDERNLLQNAENEENFVKLWIKLHEFLMKNRKMCQRRREMSRWRGKFSETLQLSSPETRNIMTNSANRGTSEVEYMPVSLDDVKKWAANPA